MSVNKSEKAAFEAQSGVLDNPEGIKLERMREALQAAEFELKKKSAEAKEQRARAEKAEGSLALYAARAEAAEATIRAQGALLSALERDVGKLYEMACGDEVTAEDFNEDAMGFAEHWHENFHEQWDRVEKLWDRLQKEPHRGDTEPRVVPEEVPDAS